MLDHVLRVDGEPNTVFFQRPVLEAVSTLSLPPTMRPEPFLCACGLLSILDAVSLHPMPCLKQVNTVAFPYVSSLEGSNAQTERHL